MQDEEGNRIEQIVEPIVRDHGMELVDLEWHGRRPRGVLRVYVDKPGGVAIADCERASREIGDVLEVAGVIAQGYDLEVSSPGLDRQLRSDREFRWAIGRKVQCWMAGGQEVRGVLAEVSGELLVLDAAGGRTELPRSTVTKARLEAETPWPRRGEGALRRGG